MRRVAALLSAAAAARACVPAGSMCKGMPGGCRTASGAPAACCCDGVCGDASGSCEAAPPAPPADAADLDRARKTRVSTAWQGDGAADVRAVLNRQLTLSMPRPQSCESFELGDLAALQRTLHLHRDADIVAAYRGDRRRPRHGSVAEMDAEHENERRYLAKRGTPAARAAARDARCHEVAMAWTHHVSQGARARLAAANISLPLLPAKGYDEHEPVLRAEGHHTVAGRLAAAVTCQVGHDARPVARGTWKGFPDWPYEVTYDASGYGPYPFWTLGGGSGGSLSGKGAAISTYWSAVQNAERLDHSSCSLGGFGIADQACTHLFINGTTGDYGWAFLYTKDESWCCMSSAPAQYTPCHLTRPQRNIADAFSYEGEIDYTAEDGLYKGKAKKYGMHLTNPSNFWFWYVTDLDDKPLEQGEGPCDMYASDGSRNCGGPPKMLFHQYHQDTFKEATIDPSKFDLPGVCLDADRRQQCFVQPTNFCG